MMIVADDKFEFGTIVYLRTDTEQLPRIITGFQCRPGGITQYLVTCLDEETVHYDIELNTDKDILLSTNS